MSNDMVKIIINAGCDLLINIIKIVVDNVNAD